MNNIMKLLDGGLRVAVLFCAVCPGLPESKKCFFTEKGSPCFTLNFDPSGVS
jgi:hypothetical protein